MGITSNHVPYKGHKTTLRVAYGNTKPNKIISNIATSALAAKAAVTLAVTGVTQPIPKGNYLLFRDANENEVVVKVTADVANAATSITIAPLEMAIAVASTGQYPPEIFDREGSDFKATAATKDVTTLNTAGRKQVVTTEISESISAPGFWHWLNPGLRICQDAFNLMDPVWVMLEYEPPNASYLRGEIILGKAVLPEGSRNSPANDFIKMDMNFDFTGASDRIPPELAP